jgi:hypothetical protein
MSTQSKETSPTRKSPAVPQGAKSLLVSQSKSSGLTLKRHVPAASIVKAKQAFKNFSLSKFAGNGTPSNYVAAGQNVAQAQRRIISRHIESQNVAASAVRGITIAFPEALLKKLLPSFDPKARTIDLGEVIKLIEQNMRGTEFYCNGDPTLKRLAIQSQVQQIIDNVKKGAQR